MQLMIILAMKMKMLADGLDIEITLAIIVFFVYLTLLGFMLL